MAKTARDPGNSDRGSIIAPSSRAVAITPSDGTDLTYGTRGLYVGGAGNVTVIMQSETDDAVTVLYSGCLAGTVLPIQIRRVKSTGTTATNLVALY